MHIMSAVKCSIKLPLNYLNTYVPKLTLWQGLLPVSKASKNNSRSEHVYEAHVYTHMQCHIQKPGVIKIWAPHKMAPPPSRRQYLTLQPFDRRFITLKNDVGVQSRREVDEVWLAHSIAGVWEAHNFMIPASPLSYFKNTLVGLQGKWSLKFAMLHSFFSQNAPARTHDPAIEAHASIFGVCRHIATHVRDCFLDPYYTCMQYWEGGVTHQPSTSC